jgi:putative ABC transport system permease protein
MNLWRMLVREMWHRKVNTVLVLLAVAAACGCLVGTVLLLDRYDAQTEQTLAALRQEVQQRTEQLQEDYRKIALEVGFNVFIVPREAPPESHVDAPLDERLMPEEYVDRLAAADILTIDHLLPSLTHRLWWPELQTHLFLTGIRGEVALAGKKRKRPLIQPVEPGQMVLGHALAVRTGLQPGDEVALLGEKFRVARIQPARDSRDDWTAWIDLHQAQRLLGREGQITAIQAINCLAPHCHPDATGIPSVNEEVERILPETRVTIDMTKALPRITMRQRAAEEARAALAQHEQHRQTVRQEMDQFAGWLNPVVIVAAALLVGLLAWANVRERREELAILRALGVPARSVLLLLLGKALLLGLLAGVLGFAAGALAATAYGAGQGASLEPDAQHLVLLLAVAGGAPLLVATAWWIPALVAAGQDPALILARD